jgi:predicted dehydrogenase
MTKLGVAVIGLGPASQPHARCLQALADRVEVVWAASRSPSKTAAFAETFGFPITNDIQAAISDAAVDAVIVLTPPAAHLDVAECCFAARKHVLLEKPLELTVERGGTLVAAARQSGKRLGIVLQHRFRPASLRMRQMLEGEELGEIEFASMSVPWWRPQSYYDEPGRGTMARDGGGVLLTQAIHTLDLFRSLVGVSAVVAAQTTTTGLHRMETEDHVSALVRLANGAPGTIMATTAFPPGHPERIEIVGRKGAARLIGGRLEIEFVNGSGEVVEAEGSTGSGANIMDFPIDAHLALIKDFVAACQADRDPVVTGEEALASQVLVDDILRAGRAQAG